MSEAEIQYKWLFSEGLTFLLEGKWIKLTSTHKAIKSVEKNAQKLGFEHSISSSDSEAQQSSLEQGAEEGAAVEAPKSHRLREKNGITKYK